MTQHTFSVSKSNIGRMDSAAVTLASGSSIGTDLLQLTVDTSNAEGHGNGAADGYATGKAAIIKALEVVKRKLLEGPWPPA